MTIPRDENFVPGSSDFAMEVAKGSFDGYSSVNKFGRAVAGVQTTLTDIWDRADATPTQQIWVAPTQARIHAIVSTDDTDGKTAAPNSVGARTVRISGLTSWNTAEVSEIVTLDGTTPVNTTNAYVIIHRMRVVTKGSTSVNAGTITATAATDSTVTAVIKPGEGTTHMAIYGIPSTQKAYITQYYGSLNKAAGANASIDFQVVVNEEPDSSIETFVDIHFMDVAATGTSNFSHSFNPPLKVTGPAIIKMQGIASAADTDGSAGFDLILIDN